LTGRAIYPWRDKAGPLPPVAAAFAPCDGRACLHSVLADRMAGGGRCRFFRWAGHARRTENQLAEAAVRAGHRQLARQGGGLCGRGHHDGRAADPVPARQPQPLGRQRAGRRTPLPGRRTRSAAAMELDARCRDQPGRGRRLAMGRANRRRPRRILRLSVAGEHHRLPGAVAAALGFREGQLAAPVGSSRRTFASGPRTKARLSLTTRVSRLG